jgi:hypothetical protein
MKRYELIQNNLGHINIHYFINGDLENIEFHSNVDGSDKQLIKEGYTEINAKNWLGLEQDLRYSNLFAKAFLLAKTDLSVAVGMNFFMVTLVNGKSGQASENSLEFAFSVLGVTWTESEKTELNTILENNNFTIRL